jgi:hypothetical protein
VTQLFSSREESKGMFVGQGPTQDPESIRMILLWIAAGVVIFWRTVIKIAIIVAIVLTVLGALTLSQGVH